jgi:hypothetical protein
VNKLQEDWPSPLWPYVAVVSAFLDRRVTADELEAIYLAIFKHDDREWPSDVFEPLNEIFLDLDAYWPQGQTGDRYAITSEEELRTRIGASFDKLSSRRWSVARF